MAQNLIGMPKTADFKINGYDITIRDHMILNTDGLFGDIMDMIRSSHTNIDTLCQFEKHGISFETAIEYCAKELEHNAEIFTGVIYWYYNDFEGLKENSDNGFWEPIHAFSKSAAGKAFAEQHIEKIRSCGNWGELHDELKKTSKFSVDMRNRITVEMKRCLKV